MLAHNPKPLPPFILVVEDDPSMRQVLQDVLQYGEYQVALAANACEGLHLLRASCPNPQLIITDIMMPNMDGHEFLQAVRAEKQWQYMPFLFISGQSAASFAEKQIQSTRVNYLLKPFRVPHLLEVVAQAIS